MPQEQTDADHLHFWSFIEHAVERVGREVCRVDPLAMRLAGMSRAAVSALVNTVERGGLVGKERAAYDGRALQLRLTDAGQEAITSAFQAHDERRWIHDHLGAADHTCVHGGPRRGTTVIVQPTGMDCSVQITFPTSV
ncbi:MarR family winged helix-turn-helix transcriptional regulator [Streptomyces sp. NPDC059679]|uniref:MarR family winged helix-turn-helix transcriptional regulator n=1 Tax=Streptomyces sp. NPDC059679 TaxID=3346903 RepID=UPI0036A6533A